MKFIKNLKKAMLIINITYIAIGALMIIERESSNKLIFELLTYGLSISGLLFMIRYFLIKVNDRIKRNDFIIGALLVSIAAMIFLSKEDIVYLVYKILGIAMIISGIHKIQDLFDVKASGKNRTSIYLFGFVICFGLGVIVVLDIIRNMNILYILIGTGMCICGISDIVSNFYTAYAVSSYEQAQIEKTENVSIPNEKDETKMQIIDDNKENVEKINTNND